MVSMHCATSPVAEPAHESNKRTGWGPPPENGKVASLTHAASAYSGMVPKYETLRPPNAPGLI